jgi:hypothetical protein
VLSEDLRDVSRDIEVNTGDKNIPMTRSFQRYLTAYFSFIIYVASNSRTCVNVELETT